MKIAIVGSREFKGIDLATDIIFEFLKEYVDDEEIYVVSGGAKGIDSLAERIAVKLNIETIIFKPDWSIYGKSAGYIRNKLIINSADMVLAFWDGKSKGTKHSINLAVKANKPINIYVRA